MPLQPNGRAPYTSASAATTVLDAWRDRGLGVPIDVDVLTRAGVSESIAKRTVTSLEELELIDETGQPTPTFQAFRQTRGQEEYQARVQEWLRDVFGDVLQYADPSEDSVERIREAFRGYEPEGQREAMASLFLGLWEYAGLDLAVPIESTPKRRTNKSRSKKAKATSSASRQRSSSSLSEQLSDLPPGLLGLLREIPQLGGTWTSEKRDAFLKAFEAILDFTVKVDDSHPPDEEATEEPNGGDLSDE